MRDDTARYRAAVAAALPHLTIHTFRFLAEGWDNSAWEVNGGYIVLFAKRAEVAASQERQRGLLDALAPLLSVSIPSIDCIIDVDALPYPGIGYRKLPSIQLAKMAADRREPARLAAYIGAFLTALHRFPLARAASLGVANTTPTAWRAQYAAMLAALRALFPRLTPPERARTEVLFAAYLDNPAHFRFAPVLLHRDLGSDHLLLDAHSGDLSAVIDWGDASIGDPAQDFCGLPSAWLPALLASYGGAVDATFADRVAFYRSLKPYHTLIFGLRSGGEPFIAQGLAELRGRP
jgi:aminoglycoside 2''-phosphotransferase